mmetsp:Transcript_25417/g.71100  ORF Transcript_25417/g.71100 Transcript_25417/m.71100 type:complete len:350 (+) Transcript_25417:549-1598(+)|eukprot:CAMPEP_0117658454 /NCGR_PEP_ID=MMETSP0804-20121206/5872_1 /TAXON_ID=1074897 /ORGANISM="Tetraselmis astigmatica, Strain CCMP880" /LENGTH=349 /DNA_ID=CAMNT_0005464975 /DNA_START=529 /DNA_END=1578 /DNA_ORIENTATION=+
MAFLLNKLNHHHKQRTPDDLVKVAVEQLHILGPSCEKEKEKEKCLEKLSRYMAELKVLMLGDGEEGPHRELALIVAEESCRNGLPSLLATKLPWLEFETRKDAAAVFGEILHTEHNGRLPGVEYVTKHPEMLVSLILGYADTNIALISGGMLRNCTRHEPLAKAVLTSSEAFDSLYNYVELENFEVASDAFQTMKDLLTRHSKMVADHLLAHYDDFIGRYTKLLHSENFVTRKQSLKLLGELLLDRQNVKIMLRYVNERDNLCLMMNLLRDTSKSIQFEAFHVFKVFVANPNKPPEISDILIGNKEKLLLFLRDFLSDKDDEQFKEEKAVVMKEISMLGVVDPPEEASD